MKYKRLAGRKRGLGKQYALWLGDDHLLAVESTGYSEEYTRYYLKDIQALITRRTARGTALNTINGAAVLISLLAGIACYEAGNAPSPGVYTSGIFGGFFLILLLWNLFGGPTCRCHLRVPLGIEELPSLDRLKKVKKALARLRPMIGDLQGDIPRREIITLSRAAMDPSPRPSSATKGAKPALRAPRPDQKETISTYRGGFHRVALLLLIADGILAFLQLFFHSTFFVVCFIILGIAFLLLAVISLIKQRERKVSPLAGKMILGGVALIWAGSMLSYFFAIFLNPRKLEQGAYGQPDILALYAAIEPAAHPLYTFFLLAFAAVTTCIGITGLISLRRGKGNTESRPT